MDRLTLTRLDDILDAASNARILVVGDVMLDVYLVGAVDRISPEAPVPVVRVDGERWAAGGAANVATNIMALGAACDIVGCVGADAAGRQVKEELARSGVGVEALIEVAERATTVKTRVMARHQQVVRYDRETDRDLEAAPAQALIAHIGALAEQCDVLVIEDYNKGVLVPAVIRAVLDSGSRHGRPTVVDPKRRRFFDYAGAFVFKPNVVELMDALGGLSVHADDPAWLEETRQRLQCQHLLLTLGEHGMALRSAGGGYVRVPAVARSVYDVSGAGDTVTASLAVALAAGATAEEAAVFANYAAAIEVSKAGVATVSPAELRKQVRLAVNPEPETS
ncbi:MAG: D-glycero-beta-D-manno-heptose-7-phosphate kinase [Gemmatimonadetes bacterium]|nr:D-glycero-beta-D-manno-heptose-7-phosphate kinase [Gemmatimonadota bacterium]